MLTQKSGTPHLSLPTANEATGSASRLWRVTVEYELIVVADNEREAESEGEYYAGEDGSEPGTVMAHQVRKVEEIPAEWRQAIPFGGDRADERTCVERVTPNDQADRGRHNNP
jgi:hypothetical protein